MRLIDADELKKDFNNSSMGLAAKSIINDAPTVDTATEIASLKAKLERTLKIHGRTVFRCGELADELAESQRRERAAVEDLRKFGDCETCKNALRNGGKCWGGCKRLVGSDYRYEWRGPSEAREES